MNTHIKFREWDSNKRIMINRVHVFTDTVPMHFSGFSNLNNVDIYEGDILSNEWGKYIVEYVDGGFFIRKLGSKYIVKLLHDRAKELKVEGNIFENPELLKP